ncbi:hypothetical protein MTR67_044712 [Solanum verrucosum]|uniref:Uncharacterized protein n=1 Tax=Solanum verrucosum TaxID=315347 RepID=A0AAF0US16_SOLVR|nr:hypothetical protein MTR67_044712 [Solanum verrucosum]
MHGRPSKDRRKVVGETKKSGKLLRIGLAIICRICHVEAITREGILKEKMLSHQHDIVHHQQHILDMPSSKIYSTGQAKVTRSTDVTSDIGYTPSTTSKLK